jgi:hypothetical protein
VRRRCRLLYALPAVLVILVAVSPAMPRPDDAHRIEHVGKASIRDVDSSLASLSAGVAERVPVPSLWPMQTGSVDVAALAALSWLVIVLAAVLVLGVAIRTRRDRAPPRQLLVRT